MARRHVILHRAAIGILSLFVACASPGSLRCEDRVCALGQVCSPTGDYCVKAEQVAVCVGAADGMECSYAGTSAGNCLGGVCVAAGCGDGRVTAPEQCDGTELGAMTCLDLGFYAATGLACNPDCTFDDTACTGFCGNQILDGIEGCDGDDLDGLTCGDLGYYGVGSLACSARCTIDQTGCAGAGRCGDDTRNGPEDCDGADLGTSTPACASFGFYAGGPITCNDACGFDTSACSLRCGDGLLNGAEDCDPGTPALGDEVFAGTCSDLGFYDATTIGCTSACTYDVSDCTGYCGDRLPNGGEICEGEPPPGSSCVGYGFESGPMGCSAFCGPDFSRCHATAWETLPAGSSSWGGVWGSGPNDAFAVGSSGAIRRWNGSSWTTMASGTAQTLYGVWGAAADDVYAVGAQGTIRHWNGTAWSAAVSPVATRAFSAAWGSGPNDVVVVGEDTSNGSGMVARWNGTWSFSLIAPRALRGVWGIGSKLFAVGDQGTISHYNGGWTTVFPAPTNAFLNAVWGTADDNIFAVGASGTVLHYDGVAWTPMVSGTSSDLRAVWGVGPHEVYAAGFDGTVRRFDGTSWSAMSTGAQDQLYGLWGSGTTNLFAVGQGGVVRRWRGEAWQSMTSEAVNGFEDVWAASPTDVHAVGAGYIHHWDGKVWSTIKTGLNGLYSVWGSGPSDVYAVGILATMEHWDGLSWSPIDTGPWPGAFNSVWGTGASDVFAVGDSGLIRHWDGLAWSPMTLGTSDTLYDVWGSGPMNVYAVGFNGKIFRYDGNWSLHYDSPFNLADIWGSGPSDIFAVGQGVILHFDGATWTPMRSPVSGTSTVLRGVWGTGPSDVFAVGDAGTVLHWDGALWSHMVSGAGMLLGVGGLRSEVFALGATSLVIRRARACTAAEAQCSDGDDDDCDGRIDCADADCATDTTCMDGGLCASTLDLACTAGGTLDVAGNTADGVATMSAYACDASLENGRELMYQFVSPVTGIVTVQLTTAKDLDLIVLAAGPGGGCVTDQTGCLAARSTESSPENVSFSAQAGVPYYVVVDGYGANAGEFALHVTCP